MNYWYVGIIAFLVALAITPGLRKLAKAMGLLERPSVRRVHTTPIPLLGGVAIYVAFLVAIGVSLKFSGAVKAIILGGTFIVLVGVLDDIFNIPAKFKLLGQIVAASLLILYGIRIFGITNPLNGYLAFAPWVSILVTIIWVVGITNAINFIDGLDGLAAGVSAIACFTLLFMAVQRGQGDCALLAAALGGGALGFLPYNFNPAKIFMGDAGSLFLGFILSIIAILGPFKVAAAIAVLIPVLVLGLPIFDTALAILRRIWRRRPIYVADKEHVHHQLISSGLNQRQTVLLLYGVSTLLCIMAILLFRGS